MGQVYKIDRVNLITYNGQKRKILRSMRCRYLAKSQVIRCNGRSQIYEFINFRGSHFKKVNFKDAVFYGCDFWGTSFNDCNFKNVEFKSCVFMASIFKKCDFTDAGFSFSILVNTNTSDCKNIDLSSGVTRYDTYPQFDDMSPELEAALKALKGNLNLKKAKLLFISDAKYNCLNLFLLRRRYSDRLSDLLQRLSACSTRNITTYKKLERVLNKLSNSAIV